MESRESSPVEVEALVARIGRKIAGARAERGLSQAEVAVIARTTPGRVGAIERGRDRARIDTLARIAGAVGLRITFEQLDAA